MKDRLLEKASALGFDDLRITSAAPPTSASAFERWIAEGKHGSMGWLERNAWKRVDPRAVLQEAQSIISLAISYGRSDQERADSQSGVVARYARSNDYHDVLAEPLEALTRFHLSLAEEPEAKALWYVDTGPFLERDLAQRAGLGFVGKHTGLISRRLGNWFFIAEIISTVRLEPDASEENHCGKCRRCLDACPTGALEAPFSMDARKCISYLTIELKTAIPEPYRRAIGNRIYGCDDCLEVCPWNRFAQESRLLKNAYREDLNGPALRALLSLDDKGFRDRFRGTPLKRTKRRGILRNVCVALGNVGGVDDLPALEIAAQDAEPLIAEHARWAIREIKARKSTSP